ncbi:hypothetical protein KKF91_06220 [Myxococcota bacterium]|nr:hypothetical protein [Myxococcota bacterium]
MKKILTALLVLLGGTSAYVGLNWNQIMTGFMTAKIDPSAQITLTVLEGAPSATRYQAVEGQEGNEAPLKLSQGMALKPNDKIISGGEETRLVLALDKDNTLELRAADFILKALFGEESAAFSANIEEGQLLFRVGARGGRVMEIRDTNKNHVEIRSEAAECFLAVTSFEGTLQVFVRAGEVKVSNNKGEASAKILKAGEGLEVDEGGAFSPAEAEAEWVKAIRW